MSTYVLSRIATPFSTSTRPLRTEAIFGCGPRGQQQSSASQRGYQRPGGEENDNHEPSSAQMFLDIVPTVLLLLTRKAHTLQASQFFIGEASPSPHQFALIFARWLEKSVRPHRNVDAPILGKILGKILVCALNFVISWSRHWTPAVIR